MDVTEEVKATPDIQPKPVKGRGKSKKTSKEEHRMTDKRREALAKARETQKAKRDALKKEEEEHKVAIKSLHGLITTLHARIDNLEKIRLHEHSTMPKKFQVETLTNAPAPIRPDPQQPIIQTRAMALADDKPVHSRPIKDNPRASLESQSYPTTRGYASITGGSIRF